MTLKKFERFVLLLSNQAWTRYWIHWNYPQESPWKMGLSFHDGKFGQNLKKILIREGFHFETQEEHEYAVIDRDKLDCRTKKREKNR